jgi:epoxyqueuosine reductase
MVAANHQDMAKLALVGLWGTRSQLRQMAGQQGLNVSYFVFCLRHASSSSDVWQNYTHLTCGFSRLMPAITTDLPALAQSIKDWGRELGFQQVGISGLDLAEHEQHLQRWLDAGYHGEMDYMGAHGSKRSHPDELVPGTLRVVSLRMDYLPGDTQMAQLLAQPEKAYISRYALGRDYHKLIRKRVQQLADRIQAQIGPFGFRAFVDSAPVLEKAIAEQAGLGWIGKNTLVLNRKAGSYFFLSELFVDLPLPIDPPHSTEHCGRCTACLDICPTNAFVGPYVLDARRCISYLTIELKSAIPEELRPLIGNRVFGCDDCQIVCPWNRFARPSGESDFKPRHNLDNAELAELFMWDEDKFLSSTEGSPLRRAGYERWLRNLAVGLGNAPSSIPVLEALKARLDYPSELVREHVEWALNQHALRQCSSL